MRLKMIQVILIKLQNQEIILIITVKMGFCVVITGLLKEFENIVTIYKS